MTERKSATLFDISKDKYEAVHRFWIHLVIDPDVALKDDFSRLIEIFEEERETLGLDELPLGEDDVYCLLSEATEFLADPEVPCLGASQLRYNPVQRFGELGVADIVAVGFMFNPET